MQKASVRRRKAYWTATRVGLSYLWLYLRSKIFGQQYWQKRIRHKNSANAIRLKNTMLELQGLFIKAGQLISTLSNVLPDEFRGPLEELQDQAPPHSYEVISKVIQRELGKPIEAIYSRFDIEPIAAASIGQAHRANLNGKEVVVKIQHPEIDQLAHIDLTIIERIVRLFARFMKIKGIEHLYEQVEQMIEEELDYVQEAVSMQIIKQNLSHEAFIYVPEVYTAYSSKRVLTIEYCDGVKINDVLQLDEWGLSRSALTENLVRVYCQMILVDGFYHADPHPGNILVNEAGQIILLDFGAVSKLSTEMREGIPSLLQFSLEQNVDEVVRLLRRLGFIAEGEVASQIAIRLLDDVQDFVNNELQIENLNFQEITPDQLSMALQLINIKEMTQIMQIPKDWVLLNRAVVLVGGVVFILTPEWNPVNTLKPYLEEELFGGKAGLAKMALNSVKQQVQAASTLPTETQRFLKRANHGRLEVEVRDIHQQFARIYKTGRQLLWLIAFAIGAGFYFWLAPQSIYHHWAVFFQSFSIFSFVTFVWITLR
jgi:predicted unusual protein kinase regulating ubiquinone biosynthesis (AarF/ABC1/UbiB family)